MPRQIKRMGAYTPPKTGERVILSAVQGWGKTSVGAFLADSAFIMARGETGYATLRRHELIPECDAVEVESWRDTLDVIQNLPRVYGTLILDALGGFERLCHEHVCQRDYRGVWGDKGFDSYKQGYDVAISDVMLLLAALDGVAAKGTNILILSHVQTKPFKSPLEAVEYSRIVPACHAKTWQAFNGWADAVLFGTFVTVLANAKESQGVMKGIGIGGTNRVIYTEQRDSFDAKNRMNMPPEIQIPNTPDEASKTIASALGWTVAQADEPPV